VLVIAWWLRARRTVVVTEAERRRQGLGVVRFTARDVEAMLSPEPPSSPSSGQQPAPWAQDRHLSNFISSCTACG